MVRVYGVASDRMSTHTLGDELKQQLVVLSYLVENGVDKTTIEAMLKRSIRTIEATLMHDDLASNPQQMELVPVHIGSTMYDVQQNLMDFTKMRSCHVSVNVQPGIATVYANSSLLEAGISCLWQAISDVAEDNAAITWRVQKAKNNGIRVSVASTIPDISSKSMRAALGKRGTTKQPYKQLAGPMTDLITAQGIFELLGGRLRSSSRQGSCRLSVTLQTTPQLALI